MITAQGAPVRDCRIENDAFGIYIHGGGDCVIEQNEIVGNTNVASSARGNGIHLWNTRHNRILGNTIHDKRDGMYFSYADDNLIARNRVYDTRFGIHYMYSHQNRLLTNSLSHNTIGATLMFSRQSLVEGNIAFANRRYGMVFKQVDNSRIINNIVAGQNRGFFIQQANQNRFEGNTIATNDIGVYLSNAPNKTCSSGMPLFATPNRSGNRRSRRSKAATDPTHFRKRAAAITGAITPAKIATRTASATHLIIRRMCSVTLLTSILARAFLPSAPRSP